MDVSSTNHAAQAITRIQKSTEAISKLTEKVTEESMDLSKKMIRLSAEQKVENVQNQSKARSIEFFA